MQDSLGGTRLFIGDSEPLAVTAFNDPTFRHDDIETIPINTAVVVSHCHVGHECSSGWQIVSVED